MRRLLLVLLGLLVSALALAILARSIDLGATFAILAQADVRWLLLAAAVIAIQLVLRTYRWRVILPPRPDGSRPPLLRLLPILLVGYLGNTVLPARLGEPVRAVLVHRRERVGLPEALASVLLERIVDVATLAVLVLAAGIAVGAPAWIVQTAALAAAVGVGIVAVLATRGVAPLVALGHRWAAIGRSRMGTAGLELVERLALALGGAHRRRVIGLAALISTLAWICDATTFWLVGRSLGIDLAPSSAMLVGGITVLGTAVPSAPGFVGTFELAAAAAAVALGVPSASALALALLAHAVTLLPTAAAGLASLLAMSVPMRSLVSEAAEPGGPGGPT